MVGPNLWTTRRENQGTSRWVRSGLIRAHNAVRCVDSLPVFLQLPLLGPYPVAQTSCSLDHWANRLAAFKRPQRSPELEGRRVCRRRFLTIVLPLHRLGSSLKYTPYLWISFWGPFHQQGATLHEKIPFVPEFISRCTLSFASRCYVESGGDRDQSSTRRCDQRSEYANELFQ